MSEETAADNFLYLMKGIKETQWIYHEKYETQNKTKTPSHIMYKMMKIKCKEKIWKQPEKKIHIAYRGTKNWMTDFSSESLDALTQWETIFKWLKENHKSQPRVYH